MIKVFRDDPDFVLPDRNDVKMTVPFMKAYTELLVKTCHAHGAFAMGGMAALIPSRKDAEANERAIEAVREDKEREAKAGFDGTWVAHPDVVDVALAAFDEVLGDKPEPDRQAAPRRRRRRPSSCSTPPPRPARSPRRACAATSTSASSTSRSGSAAAARPGINNLMEDAATAEISRSQIWQWIRHGKFTRDHVREVLDEEMAQDPRRGRRRGLGEGPPRRDPRDLRARRARRRLPGVPHAARVRVPRLIPRVGAAKP